MDTHRDLAIVTMVQDDPEFIHAWINHYRKHVEHSQDIYVLVHSRGDADHGPQAGGAEDPWRRAERSLFERHRVSAIRVHHSLSSDHAWMTKTVEAFYAFLLKSYRWALYADVDEFLFPAPSNSVGAKTLLDFVRGAGAEGRLAFRAKGFEIVHQPDEPPLPPMMFGDGDSVDVSVEQLIERRSSWYRSRLYSKTLLANFPLSWVRGFHRPVGAGAEFGDRPPSGDLLLAHLHKIDFDLALVRSRRSRAKNWSPKDLERGSGRQNRIADEAEMRDFWSRSIDNSQLLEPRQLKPIPAAVKASLSAPHGGLQAQAVM